ncbi:hypothetical protein [Corynebacterium terpenotabidum]|nr:hypothetical protein [Corynebacterium terpenotabidum]
MEMMKHIGRRAVRSWGFWLAMVALMIAMMIWTVAQSWGDADSRMPEASPVQQVSNVMSMGALQARVDDVRSYAPEDADILQRGLDNGLQITVAYEKR